MKLKLLIPAFLLIRVCNAESPYENYKPGDTFIYAGAAAGGILSHFISNRLQPLTESEVEALDPNDVHPFDRSAIFNRSEFAARFSDWGMFTSLALPVALMTQRHVREDYNKVGYLYLQTLAITAVVTQLTKGTTRRTRPYVYNPQVSLEEKLTRDARKAFFSGHTSLSFAGAVYTAKVLSDYYPDSNWTTYAWVGALALSGSTAYCRVRAGKHFPTDVLVGALVGGGIGYLIPQCHKKSPNDSADIQQPVLIRLQFAL